MTRQHVLLLDRDAVALRVTESNLKNRGFSVTALEKGAEALNELQFTQHDVIVCDVELADQSGFDFRRHLVVDSKLADIPFVFTADEATTKNKVEALKLGVDVLLVKPLYSAELVARLRLLVARRDSEALESGRREPVRGSLSRFSLADLIMLCHRQQHSCRIELRSHGSSGALYVHGGVMIDALVPPFVGERALTRMLSWSTGEYTVRFVGELRTPTIHRPPGEVLADCLAVAEQWSDMRELLPSLGSVFTLDLKRVLELPDTLPADLLAISKLFDGSRTLQDVIDASPLDDLETLGAISRLHFNQFLVETQDGGSSDEQHQWARDDTDEIALTPNRDEAETLELDRKHTEAHTLELAPDRGGDGEPDEHRSGDTGDELEERSSIRDGDDPERHATSHGGDDPERQATSYDGDDESPASRDGDDESPASCDGDDESPASRDDEAETLELARTGSADRTASGIAEEIELDPDEPIAEVAGAAAEAPRSLDDGLSAESGDDDDLLDDDDDDDEITQPARGNSASAALGPVETRRPRDVEGDGRTQRFYPQPFPAQEPRTLRTSSNAMPIASIAEPYGEKPNVAPLPSGEREPLIRALETAIQSLREEEQPTPEPTSVAQEAESHPRGKAPQHQGKVIPLRKSNPGLPPDEPYTTTSFETPAPTMNTPSESLTQQSSINMSRAKNTAPTSAAENQPNRSAEDELPRVGGDHTEDAFFTEGDVHFYDLPDETYHAEAETRHRPTKAIILTTLMILVCIGVLTMVILRTTSTSSLKYPDVPGETEPPNTAVVPESPLKAPLVATTLSKAPKTTTTVEPKTVAKLEPKTVAKLEPKTVAKL
ncbi:MAG: response regulator, partial [Myxococcales bacterium]|nr:response regulator [Myxococcales bacterium]